MTKTAPSSLAAFGNIYAGKKVFLTGHTGFKGAWLSEWLLLLGAQVTGYAVDCEEPSLFEQLKLAQRIQDMRGDVRDLRSLGDAVSAFQPDFIFHLAAQSLVRRSYVDPVGTFTTNLTGSVNVMEAVRLAANRCAVVMVTTDKCYENRQISHAYNETDPLGGHDPYSASKAAAEIAIDSYRKSFFPNGSDGPVAMASARAGNVIGGGDWAADRLVPDCIRALQRGEKIPVRNKNATRPWQHVLDPLSGYLTLAGALWRTIDPTTTDRAGHEQVRSAFNFGPKPESNRRVGKVVDEVLKHWPGGWIDKSDNNAPHEAELLSLKIDKADRILSWHPVWEFEEAVAHTVSWYQDAKEGSDPLTLTRAQIKQYHQDAAARGLHWATK
jgi:CDP-glucose 4,6-dehydratase